MLKLQPDWLPSGAVAQVNSGLEGASRVRSELHARWVAAAPRTRLAVQLSALIVCVAGAYNYSLITLLQNVGLETPLAYASLVPLIALVLAGVRARPQRFEPAIHDRQVDYIVGIPLILAALAINLLLPAKLSVMFWVWRIDLFSMPLYVAGCVAIIFGVRVLWRQRLAVCYLLLAWPVPWSAVLLGVLTGFTNLTLASLNVLLKFVHFATPLAGDSSLFNIVHHGKSFPLSVVSACSGVNGVVGFVLVGCAFGAIVRGPRLRKFAWLTAGIIVLWAMNLLRLMFIFWAGKQFGEAIAINVLHPFVGLVTFALGVVAMLAALRPMGLSIFGEPAAASKVTPRAPASASVVAVPKVIAAIVIVAISGITLAVANLNLRVYNLVADSSGEPRLVAMTGADSRLATPAGWRGAFEAEFDWAKPYFGDDSTWYRYLYEPTVTAVPKSTLPVTADVINTTDLSTFSAYGVIACYQFHGYQLQDVADVDLGGGVEGQALSYTSGIAGTWSIVYWILPVRNGSSTHYERMVLYLQNTTSGTVVAPGGLAGIKSLSGTLDLANPQDRLLARNRAFLVAFAHDLIHAQSHSPSNASSSHPVVATIGQPKDLASR